MAASIAEPGRSGYYTLVTYGGDGPWGWPYPVISGQWPVTAYFPDRIVAGGCALALSNQRMLHHRAVRDVVGDAGPLTRLLPEGWLDVQDRKWMSRGTLETAGAPPVTGWAIYDLVRFP